MGGQSWLADILAGVMIATAIFCVIRTVLTRIQHRPAEHDVDVVHALMGISMAGMLVASLTTLPADVWAAVFAAAGLWYAWQIGRSYVVAGAAGQEAAGQQAAAQQASAAHRHHHLPHLAMCGAMVYMLLAAPANMSSADMSSGMGMGGSAARFPILALALTLILVGYVAWDTDRLSRMPRLAAAVAVNPRVEVGLAIARAGVSAGLESEQPEPERAVAEQAVPEQTASPARVVAVPVAPRLAMCCQVAMGAVMAYMLVLML